MLGIGITELVVICVIALIFVPTDDLPKLMRELGRRYGQLRRAADELRRAFVLEADRQDAEERYRRMQERRKQAVEARKRALDEAGEGAVAQDRDLPGTEGLEEPGPHADLQHLEPDDPELPAPPRRHPGPEAGVAAAGQGDDA